MEVSNDSFHDNPELFIFFQDQFDKMYEDSKIYMQ